MINTKCPECSAKFYVAENLVAGKVVRFRCRKCGGTITVDGTKSEAGSGKSTEEGADSALLSHVPPPPAEPSPLQAKGASVEIKPAQGTLRPGATESPVPGASLNRLAAALEQTPPPETSMSSEPTRELERPAPAHDQPAALLASDKMKKGGAAASTPKPAAAAAKPSATSGATQEEPPASSRARLSRISMELQNSVFSIPEDEGVDVPVDMDEAPAYEELEPEPASLRGMVPIARKPAAPKPPTPKPGAAGKPLPPKLAPSDATPPKPGVVKIELPAPKGGAPIAPTPRAAATPADDDRVDFNVVGRLSAEPISLPSRELLAPVVAPIELEPASEAAPKSERKFAPAVALSSLQPSLTEDKPSAQPKPSRTGLYVAIAVVAAIALAGGGVWVKRSSATSATVPADSAAAAEQPQDEATARPTATQTAAAPATGTGADTAAAQPAATATETTAKTDEVKLAEPAAHTESATTGTNTATPSPKEVAPTPAETKPAETAGSPPKAADTKPAETKPEETAPAPAPPSPPEGDAPFDKSAAARVMGGARAAAASCKQEGGPQGNATVHVTFAPNGVSTLAMVEGPPFAGTPVGSCIAAKFRGLKIPPFSGSSVTVRTTVPLF